MKNNIQFAVVREDPRVDLEIIEQNDLKGIFLIGSGGCTALAIRNRDPKAKITLLDPNPAQCALIHKKLKAWPQGNDAFSVFKDDPCSLSHCGNFESLFRCFRNFLFEFVAPKKSWTRAFSEKTEFSAFIEEVRSHPYWPVAFHLHFHDSFLLEMFGPAAIQHAPKDSYPDHFKRVLEHGLTRRDGVSNPFLHHILLGHYLEGNEPDFLKSGPRRSEGIEVFEGWLEAYPSLESFQYVMLSNIFDWSSKEEVQRIATKVASETPIGCHVVYRQLNHQEDFEPFFEGFDFQKEWAAELHAKDRSLFYTSLHIGIKT